MRIRLFVVESGREEHIARHGVTLEEVDELVEGRFLAERTREDRYLVVGQTQAGRYLSIVIADRSGGVFALVTARDSTDNERRRYQKRRSLSRHR